MNEEHVKSGLAYMRSYGLRLLLFFICIMVAASILLMRLGASLPDPGSASISDLAKTSVKYLIPFIPTLALAFIVGTQPEGSRRRLLARIFLNVYLSLIILVLAAELEYSIKDTVISTDPPLSAETLSMSVRYDMISLLLMCIPVCSVIDAVLEYMQNHNGCPVENCREPPSVP